ncbi:hypothetical protein HZF24_11135 [Sedimentibacter hydroxybenzoicus DSM 7310]|uniref:Uncharacterized protein n=1 Tax=Sedimentibacter hydroxybenzoicus DSM 7310 TaxID=1123245 RepID=A0A974BL87_SEDHY|nr:DUF6282 family protein [Sedimentibacter hydroxybenzoicus]NYB74690.1 hypothetical protein [Sedimentibacter hydroxybenzoicus DSM 7310]
MNQKYGTVLTDEEIKRRTSAVWPYQIFEPGRPVEPEEVTELLEGIVDIHTHGAPAGAWLSGRPTIVQTSIEASKNKVGAIVFKDHYTMTNNFAQITNEMLHILSVEKSLSGERFIPTKIYGGIVLNDAVGGMNINAVRTALGYGQCVEVWLPSLDSAYQRAAMGKEGGIKVSESGVLTSEMKELLDVLADYNNNSKGLRCALATCHVSNEEKFDILKYVKKAGMDVDVIIDHVTQELTIATHEECKEMIDLGAYLQFAETSCVPWPGMQNWIINFDYSFSLLKELIKEKGTDHLMLASDSGQPQHEFIPGWKSFIRTLLGQGISAEHIREMGTHVPKKVTGIN